MKQNKLSYFEELYNHFTENKTIPFSESQFYMTYMAYAGPFIHKKSVPEDKRAEYIIGDFDKKAKKTAKKVGANYLLQMLKTPHTFTRLYSASMKDFSDEFEGSYFFDEALSSTNSFIMSTAALEERLGFASPAMYSKKANQEHLFESEKVFKAEILHILGSYLTFASFNYNLGISLRPDLYSDLPMYQKFISTFTTDIKDKKKQLKKPEFLTNTIPDDMKKALYEVLAFPENTDMKNVGKNELMDRATFIYYLTSCFIDNEAINIAFFKILEENMPMDNSVSAWSKIPETLNPLYNKYYKIMAEFYSKLLDYVYDYQSKISHEEVLLYITGKRDFLKNDLDKVGDFILESRKFYKKLGITYINIFNDDMSKSEDYYLVKGESKDYYVSKYDFMQFRPGREVYKRLVDKYINS